MRTKRCSTAWRQWACASASASSWCAAHGFRGRCTCASARPTSCCAARRPEKLPSATALRAASRHRQAHATDCSSDHEAYRPAGHAQHRQVNFLQPHDRRLRPGGQLARHHGGTAGRQTAARRPPGRADRSARHLRSARFFRRRAGGAAFPGEQCGRSRHNSTKTPTVDKLVDTLKDEFIADKDNQITDLKVQNDDLRKLLNQQQQLQLKTQQIKKKKTLLLEKVQKKRWWQIWTN